MRHLGKQGLEASSVRVTWAGATCMVRKRMSAIQSFALALRSRIRGTSFASICSSWRHVRGRSRSGEEHQRSNPTLQGSRGERTSGATGTGAYPIEASRLYSSLARSMHGNDDPTVAAFAGALTSAEVEEAKAYIRKQ